MSAYHRIFRAGRVGATVTALLCAVGTSGGQELRLDDLVREALEVNPEIQAAHRMWEMAEARAPQMNALPDPMLQAELQNVGRTGFTVGSTDMSMAGLSLAQTIPYPGKRRLRRLAAEKEAEGARAMVEVTRLSVVLRLKIAYHELAFADDALDVVARIGEVLRELHETVEARYRSGEGIQQDVWQARVDLVELQERTEMMTQMREGASAMINGLLDRAPESSLGRPAEPDGLVRLRPREELYRLALAHNPELAAGQRSADAAETRVALMKKEYAPDFTLSAGWRSRGRYDDVYQVMLGVELPWHRERRRYGVQEAEAGLEAARQRVGAEENMVLARVRDLASMAETSGRLVAAYRDAIVPASRFSLESAKLGYAAGQVDFLTVLDGARRLLENELKMREKLADHHKAVARLEAIVDRPVTGL